MPIGVENDIYVYILSVLTENTLAHATLSSVRINHGSLQYEWTMAALLRRQRQH